MTDTTYKIIGREIGALVDRKNAAYGSSFAKCGPFLELLYPNGLQPADYANALLLVRIFDKQMRIATDADALGESPFEDIAGYGLLGAKIHAERKDIYRVPDANRQESKSRCGSARLDAEEESKDQSVSAAPDAPKPTTTSVAPQTAQPSPQLSNAPSSASSNATVARAAAKSSRTSVAARAKDQSSESRCAMCNVDVHVWHPVMVLSADGYQRVCSHACLNALIARIRKEGKENR